MNLQITNINTNNAIIWVINDRWRVEWLKGDGSIGAVLSSDYSSGIPAWAYNIDTLFGNEIEHIVQTFTHRNDVLAIDSKGRTCLWPLSGCAPEQIKEALPQLVEMGVDVNHVAHNGLNILYYLCVNEYSVASSTILALIKSGCNPNFKDAYGQTPLMIACGKFSKGKNEIVYSLIDSNIELNTVDEDGRNALNYLFLGMGNLLSNETDVDHRARMIELHLDVVNLLLSRGAKVLENIVYNPKWSPTLSDAVRTDSKEIVELVLTYCNNVNVITENGTNALMWCDANSDIEIAKILINKGVKVNQATSDGFTALWFANEKNNIKLAELLLEKGADPDIGNLPHGHLLFRAAYLGHKEMVELLIQYGANACLHIEDWYWQNKKLIPEGVTPFAASGLNETNSVRIITNAEIVSMLISAGCYSGILRQRPDPNNPLLGYWSTGIVLR